MRGRLRATGALTMVAPVKTEQPAQKTAASRPRVGAAHDPAERDADRLAEALTASQPAAPRCTACAVGPTCPSCAAGSRLLRRHGDDPAPSQAPEAAIQALATPGEPLPEHLRGKFERRLGSDLGFVRLHRGTAAEQGAMSVGASAFTLGGDIALGATAPALDSVAGERLLAHEVAHTLAGGEGLLRRQMLSALSTPSDERRVPGSVKIDFITKMPWYVIARDTASPAAIAVELYGVEAPSLIGPSWLNTLPILPNLLRPGYRAQFDELVSARFDADVTRAENLLFEARPQLHWSELLSMVRDWSQLHDVLRTAGDSWFDAFLGRLAADYTYYDYGFTTGAKTSYLDTLFACAGDQVGDLLRLVSRNSQRFGLYRPPEALLTDPKSAQEPVNPALVNRAADLVLARLSGPTSDDEGAAITSILGDLPAAGQAAVLQTIMSRHGESDWTGIFGRYGERRPVGMLYWLFEELTEDNRRTLADSLVANQVLQREAADALVAGRGFVAQYLPYTTDLAIESTQFWAKRYEQSSGVEAGFYGLMGGLSVLGTPGVVDQTALVLGTAGLGSAAGPVLAARAPALATTLTVGGTLFASFNAGLAIGHLMTGQDADGKPLDDAGRASLALMTISNLLFAAAGLLALRSPVAPTATGLTRLPPGELLPPEPPVAGTTGDATLHIRVVSFNPESGEMVVMGSDPVSGRWGLATVNVRTGAGQMIGSQGEILPIENFALGTARLSLPGAVEPPSAGTSALPTRPTVGALPSGPAPVPALPSGPLPPMALPAGVSPPLALPPGPAPRPALPAGPRPPLALPGPRYHTLPEILPDPARPFIVPELERAYQTYRSSLTPPKTPADREDWVRLTRSGPRAALVRWLGPNFPTSEGEPVYIRLASIARPASLDDVRLAELLGRLHAEPTALSARYDPVSAAGPLPGEVNLANFNILKGNVGEILAQPIRAAVTANLQQRFPGTAVYDGVRIRLPAADGTLGAPLLFTDGLAAETIGQNLVVRGRFETKAGSTGGQAATEQFFEWNEGRLEPGSQLHLPDGRHFTYDPEASIRNPDGSRPPRVIFLLSAEHHLIAPTGSETLGEGSSMGVGVTVQRHALPASADEINYLTRVTAEGLAAPASSVPPAAP